VVRAIAFATLSALLAQSAHAQRAGEDAVADAQDAFGSAVGREVIGLYSNSSARGFSPVQAGNLRIDGFYFDEDPAIGDPPTRIVRSSSVHVGIAAQGYLFPAPTGVVDYQLRVPGDELVGSVLLGYSTDGHFAYDENDVQFPVIPRRLSMGAGIGYTHNPAFYSSAQSKEWTAGWISRWRPTDGLEITPFWGMTHHQEYGEKPTVFIDADGIPHYRSVYKGAQPWARLSFLSSVSGVTLRWTLASGWQLAGAVFRALYSSPETEDPLLLGINGRNIGDYQITALPPTSSGSTSGELRLSRYWRVGALRNAATLRVTGRASSIESAVGDTRDFGPALVTSLPSVAMPHFNPGPVSDVQASQFVPGVAYQGVWPSVGQLTAGIQKVFYRRTVAVPGVPQATDRSSPWLYDAAAAVYIPHTAAALYASYTRGFEEIGTAPLNAVNRNEPVPAQVTSQVDAGIKYQFSPRLALVSGVFEIRKPYFNLDLADVYRHIGSATNRGAEISLTGALTPRLDVVGGYVWIRPTVQYEPGTVAGPTNAIAVGPVPGYFTAYFQYHPAFASQIVLGASVQTLSSRYADYPVQSVPAVTQLGLDVHYHVRLFGKNATLWLQGTNLTNAASVNVFPSGLSQSFEPRAYQVSVVVDL
jgi:iron complex outermembrane receptor protein